MKKHIAGFALFCFVVITMVVIANVIGRFVPHNALTHCEMIKLPPKTNIIDKETPSRKFNKNSPVVQQAVFNMVSREVKVDMLFTRDVSTGETTYVRLNFFKNDGKAARYINSETLGLDPKLISIKNYGKSALITSNFYWLKNLNSYENLYVTAEIVGSDYSLEKNPVEFDAGSAKEITLDWGKARTVKPEYEAEIEY